MPLLLPYDTLKDKRIGEMTPEEEQSATEWWIRHNVAFMGSQDVQRHVDFLIKRLDETRESFSAVYDALNNIVNASEVRCSLGWSQEWKDLLRKATEALDTEEPPIDQLAVALAHHAKQVGAKWTGDLCTNLIYVINESFNAGKKEGEGRYLEWMRTIENEADSCHITFDCVDPKAELQKIVQWHCQVAIDPAVSKDASDLYDRAKGLGYAQACHESHTLFERGDPDAPDNIKDRNGDIVLGLCKLCGCGEIELGQNLCKPITRERGQPIDVLRTFVEHFENRSTLTFPEKSLVRAGRKAIERYDDKSIRLPSDPVLRAAYAFFGIEEGSSNSEVRTKISDKIARNRDRSRAYRHQRSVFSELIDMMDNHKYLGSRAKWEKVLAEARELVREEPTRFAVAILDDDQRDAAKLLTDLRNLIWNYVASNKLTYGLELISNLQDAWDVASIHVPDYPRFGCVARPVTEDKPVKGDPAKYPSFILTAQVMTKHRIAAMHQTNNGSSMAELVHEFVKDCIDGGTRS